MHAEAFHYTRQTLGYPASDQRRTILDGGDAEYPGGLFRLGAKPAKGSRSTTKNGATRWCSSRFAWRAGR